MLVSMELVGIETALYSHVMDSIIEPPRDKTNKVSVRPAKTQISLGIRPVWSESSLCAQWVAKDPSFLHADSEDSDQTGRMPRLIWVFAGHTDHIIGLSWGGSNHETNSEAEEQIRPKAGYRPPSPPQGEFCTLWFLETAIYKPQNETC